MAIIIDCETNGLMPYCTKMHCMVAYNTVTKEFKEFTPNTIDSAVDYLQECSNTGELISMHNGIGFDWKVFKKLYNYEHKGAYLDTLLMSRILWPDIEPNAGGVHSVEAWGVRFDLYKPEHEDWTTYSPEMLHRCREDVKIQVLLYERCMSQIDILKKKDPRLANWTKIFSLEHKFWQLMEDQGDHGWLFDVDYCDELIRELTKIILDIDKQVAPYLPKRLIKPYKETPCKGLKADGTPTLHAKAWVGEHREHIIGGDFSRIKYETVDCNSAKQLKEFFIDLGWTPEQWNYKKDRHGKPIKEDGKPIKAAPKLPKEDDEWQRLIESAKNPVLRLLAERGKASKRLATIKGYMGNVRADRRLEARCVSCSTNTGRAAHKIIVNVPKAKEHVYYGKQLRSLFIVPEDKILVGGDASALEARMEAHYLYPFDEIAAKELIEGDIHTINAEAWGVIRDIAKGGKYAILYGAGPGKLAFTLGKPEAQARELYEAYWAANPGTKKLIDALERQYDRFGYLVGIDGRPLTIRYKHALLNTLLQNAGAVVMKAATVIFMDWVKKYNIPCAMVGNFHDELQVEARTDHADAVGLAIVDSIRKAGVYYKLRVPLDGTYAIGRSWADTH